MFLKNLFSNQKSHFLWLQVLIVIITLAAVAIVLVLGGKTYNEAMKMTLNEFNQKQLILARTAAAGIKTFIINVKDDLIALSEFPAVQRMEPDILEKMKTIYAGFPPRTSLRRLDKNGILRFIYPNKDWRRELIGRNYSEEVYFQKAKETGEITFTGLITNEVGERRIRVVKPVFIENEKGAREFNGVIINSFSPEVLSDLYIAPIVSGKTGYAWLLNEDGIFLGHYEKEFIGRSAFEVRKEKSPEMSTESIDQIQHQMMAGKEGIGRYISGWHRKREGKIEKLIAYAPIHVNKDIIWSVAVCAPVSEVERIIKAYKISQVYTLGFVVLIIVIAGFLLIMISYRWSHTLELRVAKATRELKEARDHLNNLITHASAPILVWQPEKQITIFNKAFERMSGWTESEMINQPLDVLLPGEIRSDFLKKFEKVIRGEEQWENVEIPILRKDGEIRIGLWNSANIYSNGNNKTLIATIVQGRDITDYKQAQEELRKKEENFRKVIENIFKFVPEGLLVFTDKLNLFRKNEAFQEIVKKYSDRLNYTEEELTEIIIEEVKSRITKGDHTEIRIGKKPG